MEKLDSKLFNELTNDEINSVAGAGQSTRQASARYGNNGEVYYEIDFVWDF